MTQYAMVLNTHTCIGCLACTVACKVENGSPAGIWLAPVTGHEFGTFPDVRRAYLPLLCNHCADAPCLKACPTSAIRRREDGIVLIDQDRCCGSGACVIACPYGAIHYYGERQVPETPFDEVKLAAHQEGTAQKCTFCAPRLDRGLQPACVGVCPTGARIFGDLDDPQSPVAKAFAAADAIPLGSPVDTKANTRYLTRGVHHAGGTDGDVALAYKPQNQWGPFHAVQFWLFGLAGGVIVASRLQTPFLTLADRRYDLGALLALAFLSAGGIILMAHLGRPFRFAKALRNWRSSWISRGAIADFAFLLLGALLLAAEPGTLPVIVGVAAIVVGAIVATYPALAMGAMRSIPAWHLAGLPWKFLVEALLMGAGVVGILGGWHASVLAALATLALLRGAMALWQQEFEPSAMVAPGAGIVALLALIALTVPSAATALGSIAAALGIALGLVSKLATLRAGESPSPFGPQGELRERTNAGH
jgi:dimethyl sulfoxide reductase iron-sulfur subunit